MLHYPDYKDRFLVALGLAIRARHPRALLESAESLPAASAEAVELVRFLAGITLFRDHNISGSHASPGIGWPAAPCDTEAGRQVEQIAIDLAAVWHPDPANVERIRHFCGPACNCGLQGVAATTHKLTSTFYRAALQILPTKSPELGRWTTTSQALASITFLVLFGLVGPAGWLHVWSLAEADRLALANNVAENVWVRENSVRLRGQECTRCNFGGSGRVLGSRNQRRVLG